MPGEDLVYYGRQRQRHQPAVVGLLRAEPHRVGPAGRRRSRRCASSGAVCEGGICCNGGRQLFDDFGVDTDRVGWAHIAYSHDSPDLGGDVTYTGYAVQTGGDPVGVPN